MVEYYRAAALWRVRIYPNHSNAKSIAFSALFGSFSDPIFSENAIRRQILQKGMAALQAGARYAVRGSQTKKDRPEERPKSREETPKEGIAT